MMVNSRVLSHLRGVSCDTWLDTAASLRYATYMEHWEGFAQMLYIWCFTKGVLNYGFSCSVSEQCLNSAHFVALDRWYWQCMPRFTTESVLRKDMKPQGSSIKTPVRQSSPSPNTDTTYRAFTKGLGKSRGFSPPHTPRLGVFLYRGVENCQYLCGISGSRGKMLRNPLFFVSFG